MSPLKGSPSGQDDAFVLGLLLGLDSCRRDGIDRDVRESPGEYSGDKSACFRRRRRTTADNAPAIVARSISESPASARFSSMRAAIDSRALVESSS